MIVRVRTGDRGGSIETHETPDGVRVADRPDDPPLSAEAEAIVRYLERTADTCKAHAEASSGIGGILASSEQWALLAAVRDIKRGKHRFEV